MSISPTTPLAPIQTTAEVPIPSPAPSPYFTSVEAKEGNTGAITTVQPGALREYATLVTAKIVLAKFQANLPAGNPYSIVDINAHTADETWSTPMYGIQCQNGTIFNAGLVYSIICMGGYNELYFYSQIASQVS